MIDMWLKKKFYSSRYRSSSLSCRSAQSLLYPHWAFHLDTRVISARFLFHCFQRLIRYWSSCPWAGLTVLNQSNSSSCSVLWSMRVVFNMIRRILVFFLFFFLLKSRICSFRLTLLQWIDGITGGAARRNEKNAKELSRIHYSMITRRSISTGRLIFTWVIE